MAAPAVQSLNDIVSQIQAAQAPENAQIDNSIAQNETSGNAQTAGLNTAKDNAFGTITQNAVNRGGYFSGFTPDQEAKYTGSTYLPALAKLQTIIANTRNGLMGQKATLATNANTQGLGELHRQQGELNAYNDAQATAAATAQAAAERNAATIAAAQIRASSARGPAPVDPAAGYGMTHDAGGGLAFHGNHGEPISIGAYYGALGGSLGDIANALSASGNPDDHKISKDITTNKLSLAQAQAKYGWLFQ